MVSRDQAIYLCPDTRLAFWSHGLDNDYSRTALTLVQYTFFATYVRPHVFSGGNHALLLVL